MNNTMFSIIVPVYNSASFLCDAIESVLHQEYSNYELILIDDGSTDDSKQIEESYLNQYSQIRLISQSHSGAGAARNAGIRAAQGDYIIFLDSDDYWRGTDLLGKIDYQIRQFEVQVVMFQMIHVNEDGILLRQSRKPKLPSEEDTYLLKEVFPICIFR